MRQAPPVGVTISGDGPWRAAQAVLAGCAAASLFGWLTLALDGGAAWALPAATIGAGVAAVAMWLWQAARPMSLQWDGQAWRAGGAAGEVRVMLDLDAWMLLQWRPTEGAERWLALSAAEAGPAWHALRTALHSPAGAPSPRPARVD